MCIGMHLGKDSFSVVSKNDMGEETHKHYCQIVLSTKTRIFIWEEKKKRNQEKAKNLSNIRICPLFWRFFLRKETHVGV